MLRNLSFVSFFFLQHLKAQNLYLQIEIQAWRIFLFHRIFQISSKGMFRKYVQNVEPIEPSFKWSPGFFFITFKKGSWRILDFTFQWNLRVYCVVQLVYWVVQFLAFLCSCILECKPSSWWLNDWMRKWLGFCLWIQWRWLRFYMHLLTIR